MFSFTQEPFKGITVKPTSWQRGWFCSSFTPQEVSLLDELTPLCLTVSGRLPFVSNAARPISLFTEHMFLQIDQSNDVHEFADLRYLPIDQPYQPFLTNSERPLSPSVSSCGYKRHPTGIRETRRVINSLFPTRDFASRIARRGELCWYGTKWCELSSYMQGVETTTNGGVTT